MLPDRVSMPGPLTYESGALPIALRGPAGLGNWGICTSLGVLAIGISYRGPRYNDSVCYQRFCCKIVKSNLLLQKKLDRDPSKALITDTFYKSYVSCIC